MALEYFLKIDGVTGDVTLGAHKGWFAVDGFDIGEMTPVFNGIATGRTEFSPLSVDIHSLQGVSSLLADEVTDKTIKSVELVAVETTGKSSGQTVYDLKLTNALVGSFENSPGSNGVETALTFDYQKGSLTDGGGITTSWDVVNKAADTLGGSVASEASATNNGLAAAAAVTVPANSPVHYFLKIDGVTGDVTQGAHKGWFAVDGFDIGMMTPFSNGIATGRTEFSPLSVDIHSLQGMSRLLADELTDKTIKSVELVAVQTTAKGSAQTVYDLKLTNALVGSFENSPGSNGVETALTFDYQRGSLTNGGGTITSWDVANKAADTIGGGVASGASVTNDGPAAPAAVTAPANSAVKYFLKIDGVTGDATLGAHKGWFTVDSFDIGVITPFSNGIVSGRTEFSPLSVDIHSLQGVSSVLADELTDKSIKSVELVGVETAQKGGVKTVYDLKLTNALVGSFENSPGSNGVETALTFQYQAGALTDTSGIITSWDTVNTAADTLGNNVASGASVTNDGPQAPAAVTAPANNPVQYFLKIDAVTGDVTQGAHKGWFAVDGFDIGEMTPFSNGIVTGRTQFSPLSVDIHSLQGVSSVLADELTDKTIKSVELVGVETAQKGGVKTVYDLKLTNGLVGSFENSPGSNGVDTALTFDYQKGSLTDGGGTTTSWNVVSPAADTVGGNVASDASTTNDVSAAPAAVTAPAKGPVQYFLKIDGVTGDVTQGAHKGSFAVDGFDIGEMTPFSNGSVSGRTQFSPLSVDIHSLQGVSSVLADELTDKTIKSVELVAVETAQKGGVQTVYDLKLTNALVGSFENSPGTNGVETALTFDYQKGSLTDGGGTTTSWDVVTPAADTLGGGSVASGASVTNDGPAAPAAVTAPASNPLQYFLKIDGVTGDVTQGAHKGWFAVDSFDIGVMTPSSNGIATGRTEFSPLSIDIHSLRGVSSLLADEVTDKTIKSVELVGVETTGKAIGQTVYDLKLTNALLGGFENSPGSNGVETALTFQYQKGSLTDHPVSPSGQLGKAESVAFDTTVNNAASILASFIASGSVGTGAQDGQFVPLTHQDQPWTT